MVLCFFESWNVFFFFAQMGFPAYWKMLILKSCEEKSVDAKDCSLLNYFTILSLNSLGGMQDYNYLWANCFEVTFELSCCKYPPASQLEQEWLNNRESLLTFIEKVRCDFNSLLDYVSKTIHVYLSLSLFWKMKRLYSSRSGIFFACRFWICFLFVRMSALANPFWLIYGTKYTVFNVRIIVLWPT